jgi:hypothetical protein
MFDGTFEYPWSVTGPVNSEIQFRVSRLVPDRELPYAYTTPIHIETAVPVRVGSWGMIRAKF